MESDEQQLWGTQASVALAQLMAPPVPPSWAPPLQSTASSMELRLEFVDGEFGAAAEGTG